MCVMSCEFSHCERIIWFCEHNCDISVIFKQQFSLSLSHLSLRPNKQTKKSSGGSKLSRKSSSLCSLDCRLHCGDRVENAAILSKEMSAELHLHQLNPVKTNIYLPKRLDTSAKTVIGSTKCIEM